MYTKKKSIKCNLIIDGNYLLNSISYRLYYKNSLYGLLYRQLMNYFNRYKDLFCFNKIYFVCDDLNKSWRTNIYKYYKKPNPINKNNNIDWEFVYNTYDEFKKDISDKSIILYNEYIESIDWILHLTHLFNKKNISAFIITNNNLAHQILKFDVVNFYINIIFNGDDVKKNYYFPYNYNMFLYYLKNNISDSIFDINDNEAFYNFIQNILNSGNINETNGIKSLIKNIIMGNKNRNIDSVLVINNRGIGKSGVEKILNDYENIHGLYNTIYDLKTDDLVDIICDYKKISYNDNYYIIKNKLIINKSIFNYYDIPENILKIMNYNIKNNNLKTKMKLQGYEYNK